MTHITNRSSSFRRYAPPPDPKRLRPFGPLNSNVMFTYHKKIPATFFAMCVMLMVGCKHEEQSNESQQSDSTEKTSVEESFTHEIELDGRQIEFGSMVVMMAHTLNLLSDSECNKHAPMDKDIGMLIERLVNEFDISNREELQNALTAPHLRVMAEDNIRIGIEHIDGDSLRRAGGRDESCQRLVTFFESEYKELFASWINPIDINLH